MKLYRVDLYGGADGSAGYQYFGNKRDANTAVKTWSETGSAEVNEINVTPTKAGILEALNKYGGHPDNG